MNVLRHCERAIVRTLRATGSTQSQVTYADHFAIATDDVVIKVWTLDAYERERRTVSFSDFERLTLAQFVGSIANDSLDTYGLNEAEKAAVRRALTKLNEER